METYKSFTDKILEDNESLYSHSLPITWDQDSDGSFSDDEDKEEEIKIDKYSDDH
jgi:hypothetical protein